MKDTSYGEGATYLEEGWYTEEEVQNILECMRISKEASKKLTEDMQRSLEDEKQRFDE